MGGIGGGEGGDMFLGGEHFGSRFRWWEGKEMKTWFWRVLVFWCEEVGD